MIFENCIDEADDEAVKNSFYDVDLASQEEIEQSKQFARMVPKKTYEEVLRKIGINL